MKQNFGVPLSRNEMKNVNGGYMSTGTCRSHCNIGGMTVISDCSSKGTAQGKANDCDTVYGTGHGGWCCDSCASAGWGAC